MREAEAANGTQMRPILVANWRPRDDYAYEARTHTHNRR